RAIARVRLIAEPRLGIAAPLVWLQLFFCYFEIFLDTQFQFRRRVRGSEDGLKIASRHVVGTQAKIQRPKFKPHTRQRGVEEKEALQSTNRGLDIAPLPGAHGITQRRVKIRRPVQHCLKQRVLAEGSRDGLGASGRTRTNAADGQKRYRPRVDGGSSERKLHRAPPAQPAAPLRTKANGPIAGLCHSAWL